MSPGGRTAPSDTTHGVEAESQTVAGGPLTAREGAISFFFTHLYCFHLLTNNIFHFLYKNKPSKENLKETVILKNRNHRF